MPVPDSVYFGPAENGDGLFYGQIRGIAEELQFRALQRRFNAIFIGQVNELAKFDQGKRVVRSPFPLFLMTCVGIEVLGKIFFTPNGGQQEEVQRDGFLKICGKIHTGFTRPLNSEQKTDYDRLWGQDKHRNVPSIGHIIYRFGRHTMIHGYQGRGVFITEDAAYPEWSVVDGAVVLNPYWFWDRFKQSSTALWDEFYANKEPTNARKKSARAYLSELLQ